MRDRSCDHEHNEHMLYIEMTTLTDVECRAILLELNLRSLFASAGRNVDVLQTNKILIIFTY